MVDEHDEVVVIGNIAVKLECGEEGKCQEENPQTLTNNEQFLIISDKSCSKI